MPPGAVKTERDERLWKEAKKQAKAQGKTGDYAYIMGIYQRMTGRKSMGGSAQGPRDMSGHGPRDGRGGRCQGEEIPGGLASGKKPGDFDQEQLEAGTKVELEHTRDRKVAQEIAMDHLTEDKNYYLKLARMEAHKSLTCDLDDWLEKARKVDPRQMGLFGDMPAKVAKPKAASPKPKETLASRAFKQDMTLRSKPPGPGEDWFEPAKAKAKPKPPAGYQPVRGSKKGGYFKMVGGKRTYWYPQTGEIAHPHLAPTMDEEKIAIRDEDAVKFEAKAAETRESGGSETTARGYERAAIMARAGDVPGARRWAEIVANAAINAPIRAERREEAKHKPLPPKGTWNWEPIGDAMKGTLTGYKATGAMKGRASLEMRQVGPRGRKEFFLHFDGKEYQMPAKSRMSHAEGKMLELAGMEEVERDPRAPKQASPPGPMTSLERKEAEADVAFKKPHWKRSAVADKLAALYEQHKEGWGTMSKKEKATFKAKLKRLSGQVDPKDPKDTDAQMYLDILSMRTGHDLDKSITAIRDLVKASGGTAKPPAGFTPIQGSQKGGYHMKRGAGYIYWYPGQGIVKQPHATDKGKAPAPGKTPAPGEKKGKEGASADAAIKELGGILASTKHKTALDKLDAAADHLNEVKGKQKELAEKQKKEPKKEDEPPKVKVITDPAELPAGFNDLPKNERAVMTTDYSHTLKEIEDRFGEIKPLEGDLNEAVGAKLDEFAAQGHVIPKNVDRAKEMFKNMIKHGQDAGIDEKDLRGLLAEDVHKLAHQELESIQRTLGDHGIRHLSVNCATSDKILDELSKGGKDISPMDRFMSYQVWLNHDMGYTTPAIARGGFAVKDNYHPQSSTVMVMQQQKKYEKLFGADGYKTFRDSIANHSGSDVDWKNDPFGSSIRLSDNSHIFQDKMPEVLFDQDSAVEAMVKIKLVSDHIKPTVEGKRSPEDKAKLKAMIGDVKKTLIEAIHARDDLPPNSKAALAKAAGEIGELTPKFLIGRLAGRNPSFSFDGKRMTVAVEQSGARETIGQVFGMDQADGQFCKMLKDWKISPEKALEPPPPPNASIGKEDNGTEFTWIPSKTEHYAEQRHAEVMKRVAGEWDKIQKMDGKDREAAIDKFLGTTIAKALEAIMATINLDEWLEKSEAGGLEKASAMAAMAARTGRTRPSPYAIRGSKPVKESKKPGLGTRIASKIGLKPSGGGWQAIPGGKKGGFRKQTGGKWVYWYPGMKEGGTQEQAEKHQARKEFEHHHKESKKWANVAADRRENRHPKEAVDAANKKMHHHGGEAEKLAQKYGFRKSVTPDLDEWIEKALHGQMGLFGGEDRAPRQLETFTPSGQRPPSGYAPVPGSRKGGYRKRSAGKWDYWYPGKGERPKPKQAEPEPEKIKSFVTLDAQGDKLALTSPYCPEFPKKAKQLGGRWNGKQWVFDKRDEGRLKKVLLEVYGTDGSSYVPKTININIGQLEEDGASVYFAGRRILNRPARDAHVKLGDGVVVVQGEFERSGGSMKRPRVGFEYLEHEDIILEIRDIPQRAIENEREQGKEMNEVIGKSMAKPEEKPRGIRKARFGIGESYAELEADEAIAKSLAEDGLQIGVQPRHMLRKGTIYQGEATDKPSPPEDMQRQCIAATIVEDDPAGFHGQGGLAEWWRDAWGAEPLTVINDPGATTVIDDRHPEVRKHFTKRDY